MNEARANFVLRSKPAALQLDKVRESDAGEYRCRVDFRKGRTVNTIISLRVISLPSELKIISSTSSNWHHNTTQENFRSNSLESLIGPYSEGQELRLICIAYGGRPRPSVIWTRDYNTLDESYEGDGEGLY